MALTMNSSSNYNGNSMINDESVASFSASFNGDNKVYFGKTIEDTSKYIENCTEIDADYAEFEKSVLESLGLVEPVVEK